MAIQRASRSDRDGHPTLPRHNPKPNGLANNIVKFDFSKISNSFTILCRYSINDKQ